MINDTKMVLKLLVNGKDYELQVEPHWTLSFVLRNKLGLTGAKEACQEGACGSCTVIVDGRAVPSCMMLAVEQEGKVIETIEGLSDGDAIHPLQEAWLEEYGAQCGFCSPGMIMTAKALIDKNPSPTKSQIKAALSGNICVCSNYEHIVNSVASAAKKIERSEHHG